ncbi:hypothetical protein AVEN_1535-1 [Araneus ventricosus]|uniref:Uncharacterized protein n=1 Tax=Araneus ventricosus TaxID=182803 RepID=A0A4Y2VNK9_ARAVE|nr:hypothetical protein AVEN_24520-1 [Araneus ventricosus]GBO26953.1 hypothetical protein AVEN_1535-1 [Araneus ventricosus]
MSGILTARFSVTGNSRRSLNPFAVNPRIFIKVLLQFSLLDSGAAPHARTGGARIRAHPSIMGLRAPRSYFEKAAPNEDGSAALFFLPDPSNVAGSFHVASITPSISITCTAYDKVGPSTPSLARKVSIGR